MERSPPIRRSPRTLPGEVPSSDAMAVENGPSIATSTPGAKNPLEYGPATTSTSLAPSSLPKKAISSGTNQQDGGTKQPKASSQQLGPIKQQTNVSCNQQSGSTSFKTPNAAVNEEMKALRAQIEALQGQLTEVKRLVNASTDLTVSRVNRANAGNGQYSSHR